MIRAVIFDFDGVVLDTEMPNYRSWLETFEAHGCTFSLEEWATRIGSDSFTGFRPYDELCNRATRPVGTWDEVYAVKQQRHLALVAEQELMPGVTTWLNEAAALGLTVAIASSSAPEWVEGHIDRLALRHHFGHVSCRDEGVPSKPDPHLYRVACEGLGVAPHEAIAVEDSAHGVTSAKAAGLYCVAVPHGLTRHLDFSAADLVVESLEEISLRDLVK